MTITQFQNELVSALEADAVLVAGGVSVFAENRLDLPRAIAQRMKAAGGVVMIVATPAGDYVGDSPDGNPVYEFGSLTVATREFPPLAGATEGNMTALDAAARSVLVLRNALAGRISPRNLREYDDDGARCAEATFSTTLELTDPPSPPPGPTRLDTPVLTVGELSRDGTEVEILSTEVQHAATYVFRLMDESGTELVPPLESMIPSAIFSILTPGVSYKVDCVAKAEGYEDSLPSEPLPFTTPNT